MVMKPSKITPRILSVLITGLIIAGLIMAVMPPCLAETASTESLSGDAGAASLVSASGSGDRIWSFEVNTSTFKPDEYIITVDAVDEVVTGTALFDVLEASVSDSGMTAGQQTREVSSQTATSGYYIRIDPVGNHHVGEIFTITGRTNLPEGADIQVQVYSSSFKPTQKSQSGEFSGATGTVKASSAGWWSSSSVSSDDQPPMINQQVALAPLTKDPGVVGADVKIIKTAKVTLEVENVTSTVELFQNLAIAQGGYLSSSTIEATEKRRSGTVVLRIPQARFGTAMSGVKSAGAVKHLSTTGEDVTEEYVDLVAQKESYEIQLAQYYVLMKKASKINDILAIQQQIDRIQTELNRLKGKIKYLESRIDLSTITITLQEPPEATPTPKTTPLPVILPIVSLGIIGGIRLLFRTKKQ